MAARAGDSGGLIVKSVVSRLLAAGMLLCLLTATGARAERELVAFDNANYARGTIVIVNSERRLYYVLGNGRALRYPVAIGRPEEVWTGKQIVMEKRENPTWVDPEDLTNVEEPGPGNPLGLRAMNLGWSLWRIHGTPHVWSVGRNVSNGCIRMQNSDVVDLFSRVHVGAPVFAVNSLADSKPSHWAKKVVDQLEPRAVPPPPASAKRVAVAPPATSQVQRSSLNGPPPATLKRAKAGERRVARQQSLPQPRKIAVDDDDD